MSTSSLRSKYLNYAELTAQLKQWAEVHPNLVRLRSLGKTPEHRDLWLLVVGPDPDRLRPAVWIDGNMHASELAGGSVALAIAEDMIKLHTGEAVHDLAAPVVERLRDVLFYILPRMSPDGVERVLNEGPFVRSVPRDQRPERGAARWICEDVDGDGLALVMRVQDPGGEYVESTEFPGLMLQRRIDDAGPFWKLYPEGRIEHFDGHHIPAPHYLADNPIDLNRNFPWSWAPSHEQLGAGPFAASEPESRAVVEFASAHPEIFAWMNLHTYGGVLIRPLGDGPDSKMNQEDLAIYRQLEEWMTEYTGYPSVSGFEEFLYEPDKPLRGDLSEYAYHQRGAIGYVIELWDLFARLGMEKPKRFVEYYERMSRKEMVKLAWWDKEENGGKCFPGWRAFEHPQLGAVEIGGIDPRVGVWNPPLHEIAKLCTQHSQAFLRLASLAPSIRIGHVERAAMGDGVHRVTVTIENVGYLSSHFLSSAKKLDISEPIHIDAVADGCALVDPGQGHVVLGHLEGWGRGQHVGMNSPALQRSTGNGHRARVIYLVKGTGALKVKFGSCRVGWRAETITV